MMTACHYAVVRFLPYVETGEFANVGIVLYAPKARYFGFRVLTQKHSRITGFFERFEAKDFRLVMKVARDELQRVADRFNALRADANLEVHPTATTLALWQELTKPLESMLRFDATRLVMANDPATKLNELFELYVQHDFATPEYHEDLLNRDVRTLLKTAPAGQRFQEKRVGNEEYDANFPFVALQGDKPVQIIKPLHLNHGQASKIIDHGGQWIVRVNALKKRGQLPAHVLFPVSGEIGESAAGKARADVVAQLENLGIEVVPFSDQARVLAFASAVH